MSLLLIGQNCVCKAPTALVQHKNLTLSETKLDRY